MQALPAIARALLISAALCVPAIVSATPPAAIPDAQDQRARGSFQRFARDWMAKMHRLELHNRANPTLSNASMQAESSYRGYGEDFTIELKPTGYPQAPFVGILRYVEHLYACSDTTATSCSVATTTPVTEIFRFQDGRWVY